MKLICTQANAYIKQGTIHTVTAEVSGCYAIKIKQGTAYINIERMDFCCGEPVSIAKFAIYNEVAA